MIDRRKTFDSSNRPFYLALILVGVGGLVAIWFLSPPDYVGDEYRYVLGATHLTEGYYATLDHPDFTNGPGYPLFLTPFVALEADWVWPRLCNALLLCGAMWFLYATARLFVSARWALGMSLVFALNPIQLRYLPHAKTEYLCVFFITAFLWCMARYLDEERTWSWKWMLGAALALFGAMMTRVIFGYVVTAALILLPLCLLVSGYRSSMLRVVTPFALALFLCVPYLAYTHHHTGKVFCWSTNGGELLYWMTSPYDGELGSWSSLDDLPHNPVMAENHLEFVEYVESQPFRERDSIWMGQALENIKNHPDAMGRNLAANTSRILFSFPRTHYEERITTILWIIPTGFILVLGSLAIYPACRAWPRIPLVIKIGALLTLILFGGSILLPAEPRFLLPVVPFVLLWLTYLYANVIKVRLDLAHQNELTAPQLLRFEAEWPEAESKKRA